MIGRFIPGDSAAVTFWFPWLEVTIRPLKGHVNSPSQKGHQQNYQVGDSNQVSWVSIIKILPLLEV